MWRERMVLGKDLLDKLRFKKSPSLYFCLKVALQHKLALGVTAPLESRAIKP